MYFWDLFYLFRIRETLETDSWIQNHIGKLTFFIIIEEADKEEALKGIRAMVEVFMDFIVLNSKHSYGKF